MKVFRSSLATIRDMVTTPGARPQPFGTMPADAELAAIGCGFGGVWLGSLSVDVVRILIGTAPRFAGASTPWWLSIAFLVVALQAAFQATGRVFRTALTSFAFIQSIYVMAAVRVFWPRFIWMTALYGLAAGSLTVAAWPWASRRARVVTVLLFVSFAALRSWLMFHQPHHVRLK